MKKTFFSLLALCLLSIGLTISSCSKDDNSPVTGDIKVTLKVVAPDGTDITNDIVSWNITIQVLDGDSNGLVKSINASSRNSNIGDITPGTYKINASGMLSNDHSSFNANGTTDNVVVKAGEEAAVTVELGS